MPETLYFGVGEDDQGFFFGVMLEDHYAITPCRFATMQEAVEALMAYIDDMRSRMKVKDLKMRKITPRDFN